MNYYSQLKQDKFLHKKVFKNFRNGIFLDLGAYDGITSSNTYFFEKDLNWNGWCLEPNPEAFKILKSKRKASCMDFGISDKNEKVKFLLVEDEPVLSGICSSFSKTQIDDLKRRYKTNIITIKTISISTFLKEKNIKNINYLSLDIEGKEENILKSIDFKNIFIDVIGVEDNYNLKKVDKILNDNNFILLKQIYYDKTFINKKSKFFKKILFIHILKSKFHYFFYRGKLYNFIYKFIRKSEFLHKTITKILVKLA